MPGASSSEQISTFSDTGALIDSYTLNFQKATCGLTINSVPFDSSTETVTVLKLSSSMSTYSHHTGLFELTGTVCGSSHQGRNFYDFSTYAIDLDDYNVQFLPDQTTDGQTEYWITVYSDNEHLLYIGSLEVTFTACDSSVTHAFGLQYNLGGTIYYDPGQEEYDQSLGEYSVTSSSCWSASQTVQIEVTNIPSFIDLATNPFPCTTCSIEVKPSTRTETAPITYDPVIIVARTDNDYIIDQYSITFVLQLCTTFVNNEVVHPFEDFNPGNPQQTFTGSRGGFPKSFYLGTYYTDCCAHTANGDSCNNSPEYNTSTCGDYDSIDFEAGSMCCTCGGGSAVKSLSIVPSSLAPTYQVSKSGNSFTLNVDFSDNTLSLGSYIYTAEVKADQNLIIDSFVFLIEVVDCSTSNTQQDV